MTAERADRRIEQQRRAGLCLDHRQEAPGVTSAPKGGVHEQVFDLARCLIAAIGDRVVGIGQSEDAWRPFEV